jgi:hypothetical protein
MSKAPKTEPREEVIYLHTTLWAVETWCLTAEQVGCLQFLVIAEARGLSFSDDAAVAQHLGLALKHWRRIRPSVLAALDRLRELGGWKYKARYGRLTLSAAQRAEIYARDGEVCAYCASTEGPFHIDHVEPVARGGTNDPANLCVACKDCNLSKGAKSVDEWRPTA